MPGIIGRPRVYHHRFRFNVEIDGLGSAAFKSCSELQAEISETTYYEGGAMIPVKEPARMTFPDLTLERAATQDADLYRWFESVADAALNGGLRSPLFKRNGSIVQYDRDNRAIRRWGIYECWPKKFTGGAWDNDSDEFTMEQVVISLKYFRLRKNV